MSRTMTELDWQPAVATGAARPKVAIVLALDISRSAPLQFYLLGLTCGWFRSFNIRPILALCL
jgi:hypothetical protein